MLFYSDAMRHFVVIRKKYLTSIPIYFNNEEDIKLYKILTITQNLSSQLLCVDLFHLENISL